MSELNGGSEDDYDAVLFCNPTTRATHGDLQMWNTMVDLADGGVAGGIGAAGHAGVASLRPPRARESAAS